MREFPYFVQTWLNNKLIGSQRIADPFIRTTVSVCRMDLLRSLISGKLVVEVNVHGDRDTWKPISDIRESLPDKLPPPVKMDSAYESEGV